MKILVRVLLLVILFASFKYVHNLMTVNVDAEETVAESTN